LQANTPNLNDYGNYVYKEDDAKVWRCVHAAAKLHSMSNGETMQPEPEVNARRAIKKAPSEEEALGAFHMRDLTG
jgi:hypothetical protein